MHSKASTFILTSLLGFALIHISPAAILTIKLSSSSDPIIADSTSIPRFRRTFVNESFCGGGDLRSRFQENGPIHRSSRTALWVLPAINVEVGDADDPSAHPVARADSLAIRAAPQDWSICAQASLQRTVDALLSVQCRPLLSPDGFIFLAGCCAGFGESPRGQDLFLHMWLQDDVSPAEPEDNASSIIQVEHKPSRRAFKTAPLTILPSAGTSIDLPAADAVEVHLPPLMPRETKSLHLNSSSSKANTFDPALIDINEHGMPSQVASSAIVPPFVVWRNSSFATLERLAHAAAVAARRGESFGNVHSNNTELFLESARSGAPRDISAADKTLILDQMLVHLARPLLCTKHAMRPARVLVLGDSHTYIFTGAASHYHDDSSANKAGPKLAGQGEVCAKSNYRTCWVPSASAHGLGNRNSKTGSAAIYEACVEESQASPETAPDIVAIMMGEVDMRWVAAARQSTKGVSLMEQIQTSADRLMDFVERVLVEKRGLQWQQVVLFGASTVCPISPSAAVRHDLFFEGRDFDPNYAVLRFNAFVSNMCREKGCRFADPNDDLFDYQTGQVHPFFHSKPAELHCNIRPFFFWHRALLNAVPDQVQWCHND